MSPHCTRKSFLAKLGGLFVGMGILPSLFAKNMAPAANPEAPAPVTIRTEQRAVPRKEGSY